MKTKVTNYIKTSNYLDTTLRLYVLTDPRNRSDFWEENKQLFKQLSAQFLPKSKQLLPDFRKWSSL